MVDDRKIRDSTFDMMKGLAIILMIVGHRVAFGYRIIYSFHMPLFFIIAGFFYRPKPILGSLKNDSRRLLLPYLIVGLITMFATMAFKHQVTLSGLLEGVKSLIWAKAAKHDSPIWGEKIWPIGAIWFLFALFWTKNIFNNASSG